MIFYFLRSEFLDFGNLFLKKVVSNPKDVAMKDGHSLIKAQLEY